MEGAQLNTVQLIHGDSGNVEYYTPEWILHGARTVMGGIDLDPASSAVANERVKAERFYTVEDDGLAQPWFGRLWMNHPFGRGANQQWIDRLVSEYTTGNVTQACCICYASTSENWFRSLMRFPICFIHGRVNYVQPNGKTKIGVSKGSCVTYMGPHVRKFYEVFKNRGTVMLPLIPGTIDGVIL